MSTRNYGTSRLRPPPPPPKRTSSSRDTSPDSGVSVSSASSFPSTSSLGAAPVTGQTQEEESSQVASSTQNTEADYSQLLDDICSSLDSSTLTVLSLPAVTSKVEKLRTNSHSLNDLKVNKLKETKLDLKKPPVPVRRDSLRLERRKSNRVMLEDRFSFRLEDYFPPPPPFTNCPKTFPTKELFGVRSPIPEYKTYEEHEIGPFSKPTITEKTKSRKSDGAFFSKIFTSKLQSEPLRTSLGNTRYDKVVTLWQLAWMTLRKLFISFGVLEEKKDSHKELSENKKPVIAKKPTLDRSSVSFVPGSVSVTRSQSLRAAPRPRIQVQRLSEAGARGRDKENVHLETGGRVHVVRRAPPPPPRAQWWGLMWILVMQLKSPYWLLACCETQQQYQWMIFNLHEHQTKSPPTTWFISLYYNSI